MAADNLEQNANEDFEAGKYESAAEKITSLISGRETCAKHFITRGQCYLKCRKYQQALADAKSALEMGEERMDSVLLGVKAATHMHKFDDAYNFFKIGDKIDSTNDELMKVLKDLQLAVLEEYELEGGEENQIGYSAIDFCSQDPYPGDDVLLKMEKEILDVKFNINDTTPWKGYDEEVEFKQQASDAALQAHSLVVAGQLEEAVQKYTFAIETEPTNAILRRLRAEVYFLMEDKTNALRDLWAIPKNQRRLEVWRLGGQILHDLNLPISAELWFKIATKLTEGKDEGVKVLFQRSRVQRLYSAVCKEFPVRVEFGDYGKCVIAAKSLKAKDEIFTEKPLIMGPVLSKGYNAKLSCDNCLASIISPVDYFGTEMESMEADLKELINEYWPDIQCVTCDKCNMIAYCSEECRQESWIGHHEFICPARNVATKQLYEIAENLGKGYNKDGVWTELWDAQFSPILLAKMWASIIAAVKYMKENGDTKPTAEQWAKAKSPFRKFIAFGSSSAAHSMPTIFNLMKEIFKDCGDGIEYNITEGEFNGRYYQAMCNLQSFSSPITPYHRFMTQISKQGSNPMDTRGLRMLKYLKNAPTLNKYCGMFTLHACLNHSCANNVEVSDADLEGYGGISVTAKSDIKEGDELFTTYIDTTMPRKLRRAWLYRSFNFWCHCPRCEFEGDGPETCTECKKKAEKGSTFPGCGKCHRAWYCSVPCQKSAWRRGHKKICTQQHSKTVPIS